MNRKVLFTGLVALLLCASGARADDPPALSQPDGRTGDIDVDRQRPDDHAPRTLVFLRENQQFLRAQLDQLRTKITWHDAHSRDLSDHEKWLRGLGEAQTAAVDSLELERQRLAQRTVLARIEELAEIEAQLDRFEAMLSAQHERLDEIEDDYVGRQETAVALLATGLPDEGATAILIEALDGESVRVELGDATRRALATGAIAQLLHDFVEPRSATVRVSCELIGGEVVEIGELAIDPARDRLTFVQIDLTQETGDDGQLVASVWER